MAVGTDRRYRGRPESDGGEGGTPGRPAAHNGRGGGGIGLIHWMSRPDSGDLQPRHPASGRRDGL
jgi:hypothetical protein